MECELIAYTVLEARVESAREYLQLFSSERSTAFPRRVLVTVADAPEPLVPMTPEYALEQIGRTLVWPSQFFCTIEHAGLVSMKDTCGRSFLYERMSALAHWQDDGTPCAMPAGGA